MKGLMRLVLFLLLFSPAGAMAASDMFVQVEMFPEAKIPRWRTTEGLLFTG